MPLRRRRWIWVRRALALLALTTAVVFWARQIALPTTPHGVTVEDRHVMLSGRKVAVNLYTAPGNQQRPLIIIAHGFTRDRRHMAGWGGLLAAEGFNAAVLTQPALMNHSTNAKAIAELAIRLRQELGTPKVALLGYSMGGLTTLLASQQASIDAWLGLDPVDMNGQGVKAAASLHVPTAILYAEDEPLNLFGSPKVLAAALPAGALRLKVNEAKHLDAEFPTSRIGHAISGPAGEIRRQVFKRYVVAFFKAHLLGDTSARQQLEAAKSDPAVTAH